MKRSLNQNHICRLIGIAAILVWSAVSIYFYVAGRIDHYIRLEYLRFSTFLAGLGLAIVALFNLLVLKREGFDDNREMEDRSIVGNMAMALMMVVPMLGAAALLKDQDYSAEASSVWESQKVPFVPERRFHYQFVPSAFSPPKRAVDSSGAVSEGDYDLADLEKVVERSAEGNLMLGVDQLFYTQDDAVLQRVLDGQPVEVVAQFVPEVGYNPSGKRVRIFTLMASCCAMHGPQVVSVPAEFARLPPEFEEESWVKVVGRLTYPMENGRKQAVINVQRMERTNEPKNDLVF